MAYLTNTTRPAFMYAGPLTTRQTPTPLVGTSVAGNKQPAMWAMSGTDAVTAVRVTGYITDAGILGMSKGDLLWYIKTDAAPITMQMMIVSAVNTNGSADLSDGLAVTASNSD